LDSQRIVFLFLLACKPSIARTPHVSPKRHQQQAHVKQSWWLVVVDAEQQYLFHRVKIKPLDNQPNAPGVEDSVRLNLELRETEGQKPGQDRVVQVPRHPGVNGEKEAKHDQIQQTRVPQGLPPYATRPALPKQQATANQPGGGTDYQFGGLEPGMAVDGKLKIGNVVQEGINKGGDPSHDPIPRVEMTKIQVVGERVEGQEQIQAVVDEFGKVFFPVEHVADAARHVVRQLVFEKGKASVVMAIVLEGSEPPRGFKPFA